MTPEHPEPVKGHSVDSHSSGGHARSPVTIGFPQIQPATDRKYLERKCILNLIFLSLAPNTV